MMNPKDIEHGAEARAKLFNGIEKLAKLVSCTLGPKGRNVLIEQKWMGPTITNDGVTIANEVFLEDKFENMGAQMVKEVARKTNDEAGDGTTTATVLAHAMIKEGLDHINNNNINPVLLKKGIDQAVKIVVAELEKMKKPIVTREEMAQVATISSQNEEIGELIADVFEKVGAEGVIQVENSPTTETTIKMVEGLQFDKGYLSPLMMTETAKQSAVLEDVYILIADMKITALEQILPLMEDLNVKNVKQLFIIADDIQQQALALMIVNKLKGQFITVAVKSPDFGDKKKALLQDYAVLTGGKVISEERGDKLENVTIEDLGRAKRVVVTKDTTTIIEGAGKKEDIELRIKEIKEEMDNPTLKAKAFEKEKMQERYGKLSGGIAVISIGAHTEVEAREKKFKIEDALSATHAAIEEGIIIGGGCALLKCAQVIKGDFATKDECVGAEIVQRALTYPIRKIAENAGDKYEGISKALHTNWDCEPEEHQNIGYDANAEIGSDGRFVDMYEAGIIDPKKVTRCALEYAASVAGMFLTTEAAVVEIPEEVKADNPAMNNAFM